MKRFELIRLLTYGRPDDEIYIHGAARAATDAMTRLTIGTIADQLDAEDAFNDACDAEPVAVGGIGEREGRVIIF